MAIASSWTALSTDARSREPTGRGARVGSSRATPRIPSSWPSTSTVRNSAGSQFAGIPLGLALDTWRDEHKGAKRLSQTVLFGDGTSNPMAPLILNAYKKERLLRAVSVGFMPSVVYDPREDEERQGARTWTTRVRLRRAGALGEQCRQHPGEPERAGAAARRFERRWPSKLRGSGPRTLSRIWVRASWGGTYGQGDDLP